jgi:hypothetical protein
MKKITLACLFAVGGGIASVNAAACGPNSCSGQISLLYVQASGDIYVGMVGGLAGLNCSPVSGLYTTLYSSSPNVKLIYSTLLSAQMTGRSVTIRIVDGSVGCGITYVTSP